MPIIRRPHSVALSIALTVVGLFVGSTALAKIQCSAIFERETAPVELALEVLRADPNQLKKTLEPVVNVLVEAEKASQDFEISLDIKKEGMQPFHVSGRIVEAEGDYRFTIRNDDGTKVAFIYSEAVPESIELRYNALPKHAPSLPQGSRQLSEIAQIDGVNYLVHGTQFQHLPGIFQSFALIPQKGLKHNDLQIGHHGEKAIYLSAIGKNGSFGIGLDPRYDVILIFSPSVLDHNSFHISRHTPYGEFTEGSAHSYELEKVHEILWEVSSGFLDSNEVVFPKPVSLKDLKGILVESSHRAEAIGILKKTGFTPPGGIPIEQFVGAQTLLP